MATKIKAKKFGNAKKVEEKKTLTVVAGMLGRIKTPVG
jgi:hypothetical protein